MYLSYSIRVHHYVTSKNKPFSFPFLFAPSAPHVEVRVTGSPSAGRPTQLCGCRLAGHLLLAAHLTCKQKPTGLLSAPLACSSCTQTRLCSAEMPLDNSLTAGGTLEPDVTWKLLGNVIRFVLNWASKKEINHVAYTGVVVVVPCTTLRVDGGAGRLQSVQIPLTVGLVSMVTTRTGRLRSRAGVTPLVLSIKKEEGPSILHSFIQECEGGGRWKSGWNGFCKQSRGSWGFPPLDFNH